jgi:ubiquinone/menaquinone biosynthesis C-methylase UbiE
MEQPPPAEDLAWTGERLVTTCHRPLVYEHLHRYAVAFGLAKGGRVLDIACGEGYGANLLAFVASKVIGVDLDAATIAHASAKYQRPNLHFAEGSCTRIPCDDHSIDLVASFETIEHISQHDAFLSEIKRVLAPGGILVISSPHKAEYQKVSEAANPFHEAELDHDEFVQLITKRFKHCVAAKQRLVIGSWIAPDEPSTQVSTATFRGWFDGIDIESGVYRGLYSIAVCSDQALPVFNLGMFENLHDSADTWNLLDTYDTPAQISARLIELTKAGEEKATLVLQLQGEAEKKSRQLAELQKDREGGPKRVAQLQREAEEKLKRVAKLEREGEDKSKQIAQFKAEAEERSKHAAELQRSNEQQSRQLERLENQAELADERVTRAKSELLDARWEALTLRAALLRKSDSAETPFSRILDLENRVETTTSERDHLRSMLVSLQNDLERERLAGQGRQGELRTAQDQLEAARAQLKALAKDLRLEQKQMDRVRTSMSRKLILPFGKSQRKLQQLTTSKRADD